MQRFLERAAKKELKWTGTAYPTNAFAQDAEMSLSEFEEFVYGAALVHLPDPIAAWQAVSRDQQRLVDWLNTKDQIHLIGPDTDLTLSVKGRTWENCDGHENFPDGEIFTGPIETSRTARCASAIQRARTDVRWRTSGSGLRTAGLSAPRPPRTRPIC